MKRTLQDYLYHTDSDLDQQVATMLLILNKAGVVEDSDYSELAGVLADAMFQRLRNFNRSWFSGTDE